MRRGLKILIYMVLSIACILPSSLLVMAQDQDAEDTDGIRSPGVVLAIFPVDGQDGDRFEFTLEPGQSQEMTAVLVNFGAEPIRLRSYASHIVPVANGGMQIPGFGTEPEGTVSWIEYPTEEELILQPGEPVERTLRVTVPEGTPPGQYVNAVALETLDPVTSEGSPFEQYFRKVVSVYVTVPGDVVVDFSFDEHRVLVNRGQSAIQISIVNSGNTRIDLEGTVTLLDGSGAVIHQGNLILGPIYMGQSTILQVPLPSVPPPGEDYQLSYSFNDRNSSESVSGDEVAVTVPEDASIAADAPVQFTNVAIEPNADPIVFANVSVDVVLTQSAQRSTRLTLSVHRDGELVEDFVLAENLSLPIGTTTVSQRYLPATSWEPGTYTFSLRLESTGSGQQGLILEQQDVATIEVP